MRNQFQRLQDHCDRRAVFALTYLRTTEAFREVAAIPGYFTDPAWVNAEDALFARYYFRAFDAWEAERPAAVPPAWRRAFAAASSPEVSTSGHLLLGMNAHIVRDLPFVLAEMGLVRTDGQSRKRDHDRVNDMLAGLITPLLAEVRTRFDPRMSEDFEELGLRTADFMYLLAAWREYAWRQAELLVAARDTRRYTAVAAKIEAGAEASARWLRALVADHERGPICRR